MAPNPRAERSRLRTSLAALLGLLCLALAEDGAAASPCGSVELRGRWSMGAGPCHRGGRFRLRALDPQRCAVEIVLPPLSLLAERQYLLREGEALLTWAVPVDARELVSAESPWGRQLAALPAAAWAALLSADGEGLSAALTEVGSEREAGWTVRSGRLAGHPARLRLRGARAWSLDWDLPEGRLHCHWPEGPAGGPGLLRLRLPEGAWLRIAVRGGARPGLSPEAWLFLEANGNRSTRHAF
jgi:hypothetical protein